MKNKAAFMTSLNRMEFRDVPVPELKPGEVLVRLEYVGICGSDVHYFHDGRCGDFVVDGDFMLGHEAGGVVEQTGEGVTRLAPGDKVALDPLFGDAAGAGVLRKLYCFPGRNVL